MKINEEKAKEFFLEKYPSKEGHDFAGRKMRYEMYNVDCEDGWNIDHILPESLGGTDNKGNLQCTNIKSNQNKGNKTTWNDNGKIFQVKKVKFESKSYKVVDITEEFASNGDLNEQIISDEKLAKEIFLSQFPSGVGMDYAGRMVRLENFKQPNSRYGWVIDYIFLTKRFKDKSNNLAIYNFESLIAKSDKTSWKDNDKYYQIRRKNNKFYIVEVYHDFGKTYKK